MAQEWLAFGHKFHDRIGDPRRPDQRSPIFLQFLDCVFQLQYQHPTAFEFNEQYLVRLWDAIQTRFFGTFLYNSEVRRRHRVSAGREDWSTCANGPPQLHPRRALLGGAAAERGAPAHALPVGAPGGPWRRDPQPGVPLSGRPAARRGADEQQRPRGRRAGAFAGLLAAPDAVLGRHVPASQRDLPAAVRRRGTAACAQAASIAYQPRAYTKDARDQLRFHVQADPADAAAPGEAASTEGTPVASTATGSKSSGVLWMPNEAAQSCHACRRNFTLMFRRHHCRSCGRIFCSACLPKVRKAMDCARTRAAHLTLAWFASRCGLDGARAAHGAALAGLQRAAKGVRRVRGPARQCRAERTGGQGEEVARAARAYVYTISVNKRESPEKVCLRA